MSLKKLINENIISRSPMLRSLHMNWITVRNLTQRKISGIQIYATNRCNSRCRHCNIWQIESKIDIPVETISKIINSDSLSKNVLICLEGGEFILHPDCREILSMFSGRRYLFITNGILTDRICKIVEEFRVPKIIISLDGTRETYKKMRGVDRYDNVIETIKRLKDKTDITIGYTIAPWNNAGDYKHVKEICTKYGITLGWPNVYTDQPYFEPDYSLRTINGKYDPQDIDDKFDRRFLEYHDLWLEGKIRLPCFTIFKTAIIYPDGDVYFCHHRQELLGNVHKQELDEIWNAKNTISLQKKYMFCNKCWCCYHRKPDVMNEKLGKLLLFLKTK